MIESCISEAETASMFEPHPEVMTAPPLNVSDVRTLPLPRFGVIEVVVLHSEPAVSQSSIAVGSVAVSAVAATLMIVSEPNRPPLPVV